jgi:hypothetical protein
MDTGKYMEELKGLIKNGNAPRAIELLVEEILQVATAKDSMYYETGNDSKVKLLTTTGRILVTLNEHPEITQH